MDCSFAVSDILPETLETALREIPGVSISRSRIVRAPINACFIVEDYLNKSNFEFKLTAPQVVFDAKPYVLFLKQKQELRDRVDGKPFIDQWLKGFQKQAISFALGHRSATIWAEPGSGKTPIACVWALGEGGAIVTVTKSGARVQWGDEIRRFTKVLPYVWKPESSRRKKDLTPQQYWMWCEKKGHRPWFVVGWGSLIDMTNDLLQFPIHSVIFDEVHKGKQARRKSWVVGEDGKPKGTNLNNTSSCAYRIAVAAQRRLATTGTPIDNNLSDLWGQLTLVEPQAWGITASRFLYRYCGARAGEWGGLKSDKATNVEELKKRISFTCFQIPLSISHAGLPPKIRVITRVPVEAQSKPIGFTDLTKELKTLSIAMQKLEAEGRHASKAIIDRITELRVMEACERKRKPIVDKIVDRLDSGKQQKILVFVGRKEFCSSLRETLAKELRKRSDRVLLWAAHGEMSIDQREQIRQDYMAEQEKHCVLIVTYQSFGESLNLQDTDYMLVGMLPFRPGEISQMENRGYRLGMTRNLTIEYLFAERTADDRVKELVLDKLPIVDEMNPDNNLTGLEELFVDRAGRDGRIASLAENIASWYDDGDDE